MRIRVLLILLLAAAFAVRIIGIGFGLPGLFHQDEPIVVNHALAYASGDFHPHFFKIPPLASYVLFAAYGAYFALLAAFQGVSREVFAVAFFSDPTPFYLIGRMLLGALAGTASVWALYRTGIRLTDRGIALAAAALFAFSFMPVRDSHYIYVDVPMVFCMLMAVAELAAYSTGGAERRVWWAAAWSGAAVAFKYVAAPLGLPIAMAVWMRPGDRPATKAVRVLKAALVMVGVYAALNPFGVIDFPFFAQEIRSQAAAEGSAPFWHHLRYSLYEGHGDVATLLGIAGLGLLWFKRPASRWFVAFPVAYYLMSVAFSQPYERYVMPIVPFLCFSAAFLIAETVRIYRYAAVRAVVGALVLGTAMAPSALKIVHMDHLLLREDTRTLAARWIEENVPADAGVALDHPFFSPRLGQTASQLLEKTGAIDAADPHASLKSEKLKLLLKAQEGRKSYRVYYLRQQGEERAAFLLASPLVERDAQALAARKIDYFVRHRRPGEDAFFNDQLRDRARLLASFSPYTDRSRTVSLDEWANVGLPFRARELFSRRRMGPYLEIYRLDG